MFDLEKSIAAWRKELSSAGIHQPQILDELESHLREEMATLRRTGISDAEAFVIAAKRIGNAAALKQEFVKVGATRWTWLRQIQRRLFPNTR